MATDRLYAIVNFLAVPMGGTATLPHGLVLRNTPILPDRVDLQFSSEFEFVSQTDTTLTIRNTSNVIGNCEAWVYALSPSIRLLGLQPDDGLMTQGLTPRPFVPGSPNGGSVGVEGSYVTVLQPGGVATQNVVTTWADAVARLALQQGQRVLEFDDSIVSPIVIPAGAYDMTNVIWSGGGVATEAPIVQIVEGASFTGLRQFDDRVIVAFTGVTPPVTDFNVAGPIQDTVTLDHSARIFSSGAGPFFRLLTSGGVGISIQVRNGAAFVAGANAMMDLAVAGAEVMVTAAGSQSEIQSDTISGAPGSILTLIVGGAGIADVSEVQTAFLGTLNPQNITKNRRFPDGIFTADQIISRTSEVVLVDPTAGAFNVTLPAALNNRGQSITIKNAGTSANAVTILPTGADTIDGQPTLVLSGPDFAVELTSNGVSAWFITVGEASPLDVGLVVFQPGGVPTKNVVTTWTDALAMLANLKGTRILEFDDSVVTPIVIPVGGPYDMSGVTWASTPDRTSDVRIPEGVSFTRLRTFTDRVHVRFTGATAPVADFGLTPPMVDTVTINNFAEVSSSGTGPFFDVGAAADFLIGNQAGFFFNAHAVMNVSAAVTVAITVEGEEASVAGSTLAGIVGSTIDLIWANSALLLSTLQPTFLGTFTPLNQTRTFNFPSAILVANSVLGTDAPTQLVLVDPTGGAFAVTLPSAGPAMRGQTIRLKNVGLSVNIVTLTAVGGDNIDGAPTLLLTGVNFRTAVTSDGVNTWYVTG